MLFRLLVDQTLISEGLTSAQAQIAVGEILGEITSIQPKFPDRAHISTSRPPASIVSGDWFWHGGSSAYRCFGESTAPGECDETLRKRPGQGLQVRATRRRNMAEWASRSPAARRRSFAPGQPRLRTIRNKVGARGVCLGGQRGTKVNTMNKVMWVVLGCLALGACATPTQTVGTTGGVVAGAAVGGPVGAVVGGVVGAAATAPGAPLGGGYHHRRCHWTDRYGYVHTHSWCRSASL